MRAPEKLRFGRQRMIYARFSLLRIEPGPPSPLLSARMALASSREERTGPAWRSVEGSGLPHTPLRPDGRQLLSTFALTGAGDGGGFGKAKDRPSLVARLHATGDEVGANFLRELFVRDRASTSHYEELVVYLGRRKRMQCETPIASQIAALVARSDQDAPTSEPSASSEQ